MKTFHYVALIITIAIFPSVAAAQLTITATPQATTTNTTTNTAASTSAAVGCLDLAINLAEGVSGTAVTSLQNFLKQQGHFTHPTATGYYGPVTTKAVQLFQQAQGIVSSGTPSTNGFGSIGPKTRQTIKTITCGAGAGATSANGGMVDGVNPGTGSFFGYDLDTLLNSYKPDFNYNVSSEYTFDNSYELDAEYELNFNYEVDMDYDLDFDYDSDIRYKPDFDYELDFGGYGEDSVEVAFGAQVASGSYVMGTNPIEVPSRNVGLQWDSDNADTCSLSGDFPERDIMVPLKGQATVYLVNPSYTVPKTESTSKPLFGFRLTCSKNEAYGASASSILLLHIKE